jgi:hypothetical protein
MKLGNEKIPMLQAAITLFHCEVVEFAAVAFILVVTGICKYNYRATFAATAIGCSH